MLIFNPGNSLSANPTKWSNTLKQFLGKLQIANFVGLAFKGLILVIYFLLIISLKENAQFIFLCNLIIG